MGYQPKIHIPKLIASGHMHAYLEPLSLKEHINYAVSALRDYKFDTVAFRGMSGAIIGPSVAMALNKSMLLVRKPEDTTHSSLKVEGDWAARRYIIVDDFVESGGTRDAIKEAIAAVAPKAKCLGVLEVTHLEYKFDDHEGGLYPLTQ